MHQIAFQIDEASRGAEDEVIPARQDSDASILYALRTLETPSEVKGQT